MTDTDTDTDGREHESDRNPRTSDEIVERVDRLESLVEEQQALIEDQRERLADRERADGVKEDHEDETSAPISRRSALTAGGILAMLGLGMGTASADAQGQVGTSNDPLTALYTQVMSSGTGSPLTINTDGGTRALELGIPTSDPTGNTGGGNVVAGYEGNSANGFVGAAIGGGGSTGSVTANGSTRPNTNEVLGPYGTVAGGLNNRAGENPGKIAPTVSGGSRNTASGVQSTVGGGNGNTGNGNLSTICGGNESTASGVFSTVGGGTTNTADGYASTVSGGHTNTVNARFGTIGGGGPADTNNPTTTNNVVHDVYGTISGGGDNQAGSDDGDSFTATYATVGGGHGNTASDSSSTVGGGRNNTASERRATIGGGIGNTASGQQSTVAGGSINTASDNLSTVGGGQNNTASENGSTVGGGTNNTASGNGSTVPGGDDNEASNSFAFAAGRRAKADHVGTYVWADSEDVDFSSTGDDQYLVRAAGGMGIGTNAPETQLHVADSPGGTNSESDAHIGLIEHPEDTNFNSILALRTGYTGDPGVNTNFLTFFNGTDNAYGSIEGDGSGGVSLDTSGSDYAEYLPRSDRSEDIESMDIVGVVAGAVTRRTDDADQVLVVSDQSSVRGNSPGPDPEDREDHEVCAFVGQVPAEVRGPVDEGDIIVPSGEHDGTGRAIDPNDYRLEDGPIVGRAWEGSNDESIDEVTVAVGLESGEALQTTVAGLHQRIDDLEAENGDLRRQLDALDARIGESEPTETATSYADD